MSVYVISTQNKKQIKRELEKTQEKVFQAACKMKMRTDLAGKVKLKRKWVKWGKGKQRSRKNNINVNKRVTGDDKRRELEQVSIAMSMAKEA